MSSKKVTKICQNKFWDRLSKLVSILKFIIVFIFQFQGSVVLSQKDSETQEEKKIQKITTGGFLCQLQVNIKT